MFYLPIFVSYLMTAASNTRYFEKGRVYRECGAHADQLHVLLDAEQFSGEQLEQIAPVRIIDHMQLVEHDDT